MKIAVIDDDSAIIMLLDLALTADGHEVVSVLVKDQTVSALIDGLRNHHPSAVILDYLLPNIDAIDLKNKLCTALQLNPKCVIFLTASPEALSDDHPCIAKPFAPLQISALVCDMLPFKIQGTNSNDG